jgi:hypothetical protein
MKTASRRKTGAKRISQVALMRLRAAAAESTLKEAKEHLSRARRRRKLARLLAKRAKKDVKQAKANLAEVRTALAEVEARAATDAQRVSRGKTPWAKAVQSAAARKKPAVTPPSARRSRSRSSAIPKAEPTLARVASEHVASPTDSIASHSTTSAAETSTTP